MLVTGSNFTHNTSLSIRLSTDGFSFYASPSKSSFTYFPYTIDPTISLSANFKHALAELPELQNPYKTIQILIDSSSTIVPFERFDEERIEDIYNFNFPHLRGKVVLYNILPKSNTAILFSIDKSAYQLLNETFPQARFYSIETPVIEYLVEKSKIRETQKLYIYFHEHTINLYIFINGKLHYGNNFNYSDLNDALYFIFQVWKTQGLNQFTDELHLLGSLPTEGNIRKELLKFIKQVYQINPVSEFGLKEEEGIQLPFDLLILTHRHF